MDTDCNDTTTLRGVQIVVEGSPVTDRPTLDTVAKAAGVSRMTVSNAYNRPDQLSAATREKVLAAARELGYPGPDPAGRSLRRGRSGAVGVLLSEGLAFAFTDPGLVEFLRGVSTELGSAGCAMLMVPGEADLDGSLVRGAIVDAFILCAMDEDDPTVGAVTSRQLPVVTAGSPRLPGVPFVGVDNRAAGVQVAQHLLGLGHRRFGIISRPGRQASSAGGHRGAPRIGLRSRIEGFVHELAKAGVADSDVHVRVAEENTHACGIRATAELLAGELRDRPTAIFAATDVLALGVLEGARQAGVAVPRQVSVVGFDDIADASRATPPLTTVAQSLFEQGVQSARLVLASIEGRPVKSPRIAAELVIRASTAPPHPG